MHNAPTYQYLSLLSPWGNVWETQGNLTRFQTKSVPQGGEFDLKFYQIPI